MSSVEVKVVEQRQMNKKLKRRTFKKGDLVRLKGTNQIVLLEYDEDVCDNAHNEVERIANRMKKSYYNDIELLLPVEKVKELEPFKGQTI